MTITDSKERVTLKREPILKEKYGKEFTFFPDCNIYISVRKKKAKFLEHHALDICSNHIEVYRSDCVDMAKEIASMFDIEKVVLCYIDDLY